MIKPRINSPKWLIVHHTASSNSFKIDDQWHKTKWPQFKSELGFWLGYHYWISREGEIKQSRREDRESAAVIGMNTRSISIALQGNFSLRGVYPTEAQKTALKGLLLELVKKYNIPVAKIVPHRYFNRVECFGKNLKNDWAQQLVAREYQKSDNKQEIELLKKQITIIEKIIRIYIKLLSLFKKL